jgi:hypothetical protein
VVDAVLLDDETTLLADGLTVFLIGVECAATLGAGVLRAFLVRFRFVGGYSGLFVGGAGTCF